MAKIEFTPATGPEEWRALPQFAGQVSSRGRVSQDGQIVEPTDSRGYQMVRLRGVNGGKPIGVHRLVAHVFHGECPDGKCVDHIDSDPGNNRPENVQYVTPSENTRLYWQRRREAGPILWRFERLIREARSVNRRVQASMRKRDALIAAHEAGK